MSFVAAGNSFAPPPKPTPWDRRRYIHIYAEAFGNGRINYSLDVLAGDTPPQIVDGYAQWAPVAMPLRVGQLVYKGRNPIAMQISLRFMLFDRHGSWLTDDGSGMVLEEQLRLLDWMAGEGINSGPSPLIWLTTYNNIGQTTPLIPFDYQSGTSNVPEIFGDLNYSPQWVITSLAWDPNPIRTANQIRIRQEATVTATMYQSLAGQGSRKVPRPKAMIFRSRPGADTPLKIARAVPAEDPPKLATAIVQAPQNKHLRLRSVNQTIKHGKRVTVPSSVAANKAG